MAAPAVSGALAILMEAHDSGGDGGIDLLPSSYRALLTHGAQDIEQKGPDFRTGFGKVDIVRSLKLLSDSALTQSTIDETGQKRVATLNVPNGARKLKVTLVWDDAPASPNALVSLVNDLDLRLSSPNQQQFPWVLDPTRPNEPATAGIDHVNVVEQVEVEDLGTGPWSIEIAGAAVPVPPQPFSLVVSFE